MALDRHPTRHLSTQNLLDLEDGEIKTRIAVFGGTEVDRFADGVLLHSDLTADEAIKLGERLLVLGHASKAKNPDFTNGIA